ncbi:MAG: sulfatase-like hydrolase/transferase [Cyclobacteriaceae bacterium]
MTRRNTRHPQWLISIYCLFILTLASCTTPTETQETTSKVAEYGSRPNILWLVAEDMSPYLEYYGDSTIHTPNLHRIASEGIIYTNVYSTAGVCAPSRSTIATGMYQTSMGTHHMRTTGSPDYLPEGVVPYSAVIPPEVKMHSEYLRRAGYYVTNNSKEDYQFKAPVTAWDESSNTAHWRNRPEGKPFFAIFNFNICHESGMWLNAEHQLTVDPDSVPVWPYYPDTPLVREEIARMYSNILEMDQQVGEVLDQLEADGLMDSTIIVFYADHGGPLPRQKREIYDTGLKVPMFIRYPDKRRAGEYEDELVSFVDFTPTLLSMAGVAPPTHLQGRAFAGKYEDPSPRQYIYAARDRLDSEYDMVRGVRDERFKYFKNYQPEKPYVMAIKYREQMRLMRALHEYDSMGQLNEQQSLWFRDSKPEEELYDLENDPYELNNLADDPAYQDKLAELRQKLLAWQEKYGDKGFVPETEMLREMWPGLEQPITEKPLISSSGGALQITCPTQGASIAYQLKDADGNELFPSWQVYTEPIQVQEGQSLSAISERIGYAPSEEITYQP